MTDFLRHLRAAWHYLRYVPYVAAYDHEDYWTDEDANTYNLFLKSSTGQKLSNRCANLIRKSAVNATQDAKTSHTQTYGCGLASGITAAFAFQESHRVTEALTEPQPKETLTPEEEMERLSP